MTNEIDIRAAINIRLTSIKILKILVMKPLFLYSLQKEWFNETTNIIMKKIIGKKYSYENFLKTILLFPVISQINCSKPGIAGIVLTIGMAVDANVIIFERIRDEINNEKKPISAVESGYSKSFGTILDANITTLIASLVLFFLGTGPVKGFAVTLSIGIITSVFTAFVITRLLIAMWILKKRPDELSL